MSVPPLVQVAVELRSVPMKQRLKLYEPLHVGTPVTVSVALSVTLRGPPEEISAEPLIDGLVVVLEAHSPSAPRAKSKSVAVSDCEERVSPMKTLKHLPPRLVAVRSIPPSKNSEIRSVLPTPSCLLAVSQGVEIVPVIGRLPELVVAQMASPERVDLQSTPWATEFVPRVPFAPPFQR